MAKMESVKCEFGENAKCDLNANTNCYLCLASISSDSQIKCENVLFAAIKAPGRFSLRSICRYLNIKLTKDLTVITNNFSVTLCVKCASVSSKLSDLCMELELLRMKVNHSLQSFFDAMNESEPFEAEIEDIYINPVEDLRKEIKKKCDAKLNSIQPKVLINEEIQIPAEKFSAVMKQFPQAPESTHFDDDDDEQPESVHNTSIEQISAEIPPKHQIQQNANSLMTHYKLPTISSEDFKIYCDHVFKVEVIFSKRGSDLQTTIYHCSYCPLTFLSHECLQVHLHSNHKEIIAKKLTELQKSSTVDEITSFQLPCLELASPTLPPVHINQKSKSSNSNARNKYPCTLCGPSTKFSSHSLRKHRVRIHVDNLLKDYKSPNISPDNFKSYCAHIFKVELISSKKGKSQKGSPICYCPYCQKPMVPEFLKNHLYSMHKVIMTKKLVELQKSTSFDELTAVKLPPVKIGRYQRGHNECGICGKIYSHPSNLLRHKKFSCKGSNDKIKNRNRFNKCHACGKNFTNPSNLLTHKKNICEGFKESKDQTLEERIRKRYNKCQVCGKVYSDPSNLLRHKKTAHQLFKTSRNKVPQLAKKIKTDPGPTAGISIDLDDGGEEGDLICHSENVEDEDWLESEETKEYYDDGDELEQMDVEKERDVIVVKNEQFND